MDRALLQELLAQGLTLREIGERVDRDLTTVGYWVKKHGLKATHHDRFAPKGGLPKHVLEPLVDDDLSIPCIAERIGVTTSTVRYWIRRHGLETQRMRLLRLPPGDRPQQIRRFCPAHGVVAWAGSGGRYRCTKCRADRVMARRRRVKQILVAEAGGCCRLCGYERFAGALHFHHLDPSTKQFNLSLRGVTRGIEHLRVEANKCALLCSNCHAEVEAGVAVLDSDPCPQPSETDG